MKERIAIIDGVRTPMGKVGGQLRRLSAVDLGVHVVKENYSPHPYWRQSSGNELVFGNVAQPANAANYCQGHCSQSGIADFGTSLYSASKLRQWHGVYYHLCQ